MAGQVAGMVSQVEPAADIIDDIVTRAIQILEERQSA
jgi:NAD(P)H-dependent flavin oxidoreductase YrpB (nitropropane dioxygenase family)